MTTITLDADTTYPTPKARRANFVYTIAVLSLIAGSVLIPAPFGAFAAVAVGLAGIVSGAIVRYRARKETKRNNIAKLGISLSSVWLGINLIVLGFLAITLALMPYIGKVEELVR